MNDVDYLPIIDKQSYTKENPQLVGWLTKHDVIRHYVKNKAKSELQEVEDHIFDITKM